MKTRLDQRLVELGLSETRTKASALIMAGKVRVEGKIQDKSGFFVDNSSRVTVAEGPKYVSRGGDKLASVAGKLNLNFKDKIVIDVGSSTGGFTDYALQHGAQKIYAIDVGTGQLDYKLRNNPKVIVMEKTDIRDITSLPELADIALTDVSFISLRQVLPIIHKLVHSDGMLVAMAKPHFEADKKTASMHKGVIKNDTVRRQILKQVEVDMKRYFVVKAKADSAVAGRKGNVERFYLLQPIKSL